MAQHLLLNRLAAAELAFAQFNAHRTSTSIDADIRSLQTQGLQGLIDGSRPGVAYYNRAMATEVGHLTADALDELPAAVLALELRPSEVQPDTVKQMLALGFRPSGSLCYLAAVPSTTPLPVKLQVMRLGETQTDLFFDLLESSGAAFPPERRQAKRHFYCTAQFQAFVATDPQGTPMGWGTMFLHAGVAFLGNSYTRPECRGRGAHSALLAARLNAASDAGVSHIFTDVEHATQSHANCERAGLRTITVNTIWERPAQPR